MVLRRQYADIGRIGKSRVAARGRAYIAGLIGWRHGVDSVAVGRECAVFLEFWRAIESRSGRIGGEPQARTGRVVAFHHGQQFADRTVRSEEHTSELQSLMRI